MYGAMIPLSQRLMQLLGPRAAQLYGKAAEKGGTLMEHGIPGMFRDVTPKLLNGPTGGAVAKQGPRAVQAAQNGAPRASYDELGALGTAAAGAVTLGRNNNPRPAPGLLSDQPYPGPDELGKAPPITQGGDYNDSFNAPYNPATAPNNSSQAQRGAPVPPPGPRAAPARPAGQSVTGLTEEELRMLMGGLEGERRAPATGGPMLPENRAFGASGLTEEQIRSLVGGLY
jgi:hypothetical protein